MGVKYKAQGANPGHWKVLENVREYKDFKL